MVEELLGGQDPLGDGRRRTGSVLRLVQCELDFGRARGAAEEGLVVGRQQPRRRFAGGEGHPRHRAPTDVGAEPSQTLERRKTGDKTNRQTTVMIIKTRSGPGTSLGALLPRAW